MKKYKSLGLLSILVLSVLLVNSSNVNVGADSVPFCTEDKLSGHDIEIKETGTNQISLTSKAGTWDLKLFVNGVSKNVDANNSPVKITLEKGKPYVVDLPAGVDVNLDGSVATLTTPEGCAMTVTEKENGKDVEKKASKETAINYDKEAKHVVNPSENAICKNFVAQAATNGVTADARETFPYCYSTSSDVEYDDEYIDVTTKNVLEMLLLFKDLTGDYNEEELSKVPDGYDKVDDVSLGKLSCPTFTNGKSEIKKSYKGEAKDKAQTANGQTVCQVFCREDLTVVLDPPVATKAGSCFTYEVEVKSKVTCQTKVNKSSKPVKRTACIPDISCHETDPKYKGKKKPKGGGPNEDFDACIKQCDKGKYTQKCINKCYKKVYANNKTLYNGVKDMTVLSYMEDLKATRMADSTCDPSILNYDFSKIKIDSDTFKEQVKKLRKTVKNQACVNDGYVGKFVKNNGVISWQPPTNGSYHWAKYATFYFSTYSLTKNLISMDYEKGYNSEGGNHGPSSTNDGTKRAYAGTTNECTASCTWKGCTGANDELDQSKLDEEYAEALEDYKTAIKNCKKASKSLSCKSKTTKFKMSALPSDGTNKWIDYSASNKTNSDGEESYPADNKDGIIKKNLGKCYGQGRVDGQTETDNENDYETLISFAGVWRDGKGHVSYNYKQGFKKTPNGNEFCLPNNAYNVNKSWWLWKKGENSTTVPTGENKEKIENELKNTPSATKKDGYNIKAEVKDFGFFNWDFVSQCFYAIYNGQPDDPGKTDLGDDGSTDITNVNYKAADPSELFPSADGTEKSRDTGWNWSLDAMDITNENYPVVPTAKLAEIEEKGDSIYNDDSELDYSFELSSDDLKYIKQQNKDEQKSNFYKLSTPENQLGDYVTEDGRAVYKSNLLTALESRGVVKRRGVIGCNDQKNQRCVTLTEIASKDPTTAAAKTKLDAMRK